MNATINTFPPFQSMNSPRGWILAAIIVLHLGFFFVLSAGLIPDIFPKAQPQTQAFVIPMREPEPRHERTVQVPQILTPTRIWVPEPDPVVVEPEATKPPLIVTNEPETPVSDAELGQGPTVPVIRRPEIDPRRALSDPVYPARAIRENRTGTVLLSVEVLENGRVGEVRVQQSSGHADLDESARREARRWRLKPGTRDGIPVTLWLQIPVTFELTEDMRR